MFAINLITTSETSENILEIFFLNFEFPEWGLSHKLPPMALPLIRVQKFFFRILNSGSLIKPASKNYPQIISFFSTFKVSKNK